MNSARQARAQFETQLFSKPNVVAVGVGRKITGGERTGETAVVVSVVKKLPSVTLSLWDLVPNEVGGVPTDVIETGPIYALGYPGYIRPATPGYSIGHYDITAGTFGCVVKVDGVRHILSNCHVLANSNDAEIGDAILQPGPIDGGTEKVAELAAFNPIQFPTPECPFATGIANAFNAIAYNSSHRLKAVRQAKNTIDAAIALPISDDIITDEIVEIGVPQGTVTDCLGLPVRKTGRTTGYQEGEISQIDATVSVNYGQGRVAMFEDQFIVTPGEFSDGGDSGSAILDTGRNVVGLLFAGSDKITIANRIENVLSYFNATI